MENPEDIFHPEVIETMQRISNRMDRLVRQGKLHETLSGFYESPEGRQLLDVRLGKLIVDSVTDIPRNIGQLLAGTSSIFTDQRPTAYGIPPDDFYID